MWLSGEREGEESEQHSPLQEENRGRERECTLSAKTVMTSVSALFDKVLSGRKSDFRRSRDFDLAYLVLYAKESSFKNSVQKTQSFLC